MIVGNFDADHYSAFRTAVGGHGFYVLSNERIDVDFTVQASDGDVTFTFTALAKPSTFDSDFPHAIACNSLG